MILASAAVDWLAQTPGTPTGPEYGKASPFGLILILVLLAGTALLIRSMNRQLKKLPDTFEPEHPEADQAADEGTDRGAAKAPEAKDPEVDAPKTGKKKTEPPTQTPG
ncbi:hypothetical protein [Rhodococcus tukisamuensis]|uniref:Uncharacterized protein n=1 Tax=Rhodococcus tukisamuensis TaxID=168276 RepID=A0A1G7ATF5_9NOCA|nr:hypothetical protein [Rhodococcus tukisamuensis]SDE17285.1 hypothetical protein SAMN05444580_11184 [Rhodococcus tukisamuensis]